jgi:hypothetical protein
MVGKREFFGLGRQSDCARIDSGCPLALLVFCRLVSSQYRRTVLENKSRLVFPLPRPLLCSKRSLVPHAGEGGSFRCADTLASLADRVPLSRTRERGQGRGRVIKIQTKMCRIHRKSKAPQTGAATEWPSPDCPPPRSAAAGSVAAAVSLSCRAGSASPRPIPAHPRRLPLPAPSWRACRSCLLRWACP